MEEFVGISLLAPRPAAEVVAICPYYKVHSAQSAQRGMRVIVMRPFKLMRVHAEMGRVTDSQRSRATETMHRKKGYEDTSLFVSLFYNLHERFF